MICANRAPKWVVCVGWDLQVWVLGSGNWVFGQVLRLGSEARVLVGFSDSAKVAEILSDKSCSHHHMRRWLDSIWRL